MESRSSSCAESIFIGSDCFYGVIKHRKMRAIPRRFPIMVSQKKARLTWSNFKAHFTRAFKDTQRSSRTSKTKGYAAKLHVVQANAALFAEMQQDHTLALANLLMATQAERTSVALLTKTLSGLSSQVAHLTKKLATAQAKNTRLKNWDIV